MTGREHELCVPATYDGTAKVDTIWRLFLFRVIEGRGSTTDVDDGGARLEEAKGLSWFIAVLWDDKHDTYEGKSEDTGDGADGGRVRVGRMRRTCCRWLQREVVIRRERLVVRDG
jgi:hypothetical protein